MTALKQIQISASAVVAFMAALGMALRIELTGRAKCTPARAVPTEHSLQVAIGPPQSALA